MGQLTSVATARGYRHSEGHDLIRGVGADLLLRARWAHAEPSVGNDCPRTMGSC